MNADSKRKKTLNLYPDNSELALLDALSHYIQNFKKGFKGKESNNTFILNPSGSDMFPLDIMDKKPYLGVPTNIFDTLLKTRLYTFNVFEDAPGLFLMFSMGVGKLSKPCAIRIYKRKKQSFAAGRYSHIRLIRIDNKGYTQGRDLQNMVELPISIIKTVDW